MQEHTVLMHAYARVQQRCSALLSEQVARIAQLESEVVRLRGALILRDSAAVFVREALSPEAATAMTLARRLRGLLEAGRRRIRAPSPPVAQEHAMAPDRPRSVLCVGEVSGPAALAQQLADIAGGHCLHHSGDVLEAANAAALDVSLRAADLVICQTGCLSHGAFWRVQDHCRRTGKPCVLMAQDASQPMYFMRNEAAPVDS